MGHPNPNSFSPNTSRSRERLQTSGKSNSCDISDNSMNMNMRQYHHYGPRTNSKSNQQQQLQQNNLLSLNSTYQSQQAPYTGNMNGGATHKTSPMNMLHNSRSKNLKSNTIWYNSDEQNRSNSADVNTLSMKILCLFGFNTKKKRKIVQAK